MTRTCQGSGETGATDLPLRGPVRDRGRTTQDDAVEAVAAGHLLDTGLLPRRHVVAGSFRVTRTAGRNINLVVTAGDGPAFFVKCARSGDGGVRREAAVHRFLARNAGAALRPALPSVIAWVRGRSILVFEHVDGRDLRRHHARLGRCPVLWARRSGALLAAVHDVPTSVAPSALRALHGSLVFGPAVHRPDETLFSTSSQAVVDLTALIQSDPALCSAIDDLAAGESREAFTHHDVRWDNVLVARTAQGRLTDLRLVDWEGAAVGDPDWDVGCLFAEYLSHWVGSIPLTTTETAAQHIGLATFSLASAQRAIAAVWAGYTGGRVRGSDDVRRLRRATGYVGYRLMQRALEIDQRSALVSLVAACHVQLGARILTHPDRAMTELMGFSSAGGVDG